MAPLAYRRRCVAQERSEQNLKVDERGSDAFTQLLVALHRIGKTREHHAERASCLTRTHDVDVEAREHVAPRIECLRQ